MPRNVNIILFILAMDFQLREHHVSGKKPQAYYDTVACPTYDDTIIESLQCWLTPDRIGRLKMNAVLLLKKDVSRIRCKYRILIERRIQNVTFLSLDLKICDALGEFHKNPLQRMVSEEIRRVSNFPLECPLKKGVKYVVNNFTLNSKYLPPFTPKLKWFSDAKFYMDSENLTFIYYTHGRVELK